MFYLVLWGIFFYLGLNQITPQDSNFLPPFSLLMFSSGPFLFVLTLAGFVCLFVSQATWAFLKAVHKWQLLLLLLWQCHTEGSEGFKLYKQNQHSHSSTVFRPVAWTFLVQYNPTSHQQIHTGKTGQIKKRTGAILCLLTAFEFHLSPGTMIVFKGRTSTPCVGYCRGLLASAMTRTSAGVCDLREKAKCTRHQ